MVQCQSQCQCLGIPAHLGAYTCPSWRVRGPSVPERPGELWGLCPVLCVFLPQHCMCILELYLLDVCAFKGPIFWRWNVHVSNIKSSVCFIKTNGRYMLKGALIPSTHLQREVGTPRRNSSQSKFLNIVFLYCYSLVLLQWAMCFIYLFAYLSVSHLSNASLFFLSLSFCLSSPPPFLPSFLFQPAALSMLYYSLVP